MKKVVLITGCSGGIGKGICKKFHDNNWYIIGTDISTSYDKEYIDHFIQIDLTNSIEIKSLLELVTDLCGRLDCLVNNAATFVIEPLVNTDITDFKRIINTNLVASFILAKYSYPLLKASKGNIVNIGSTHSVATSAKLCAYACSKAGLVGLTRNMAIEFGKDGIRANTVSPGATDTPMLRAGLSRVTGNNIEKKLADLGHTHPIQRVGQPSDVAELVYFVADNSKAGNITGANILVDGGATVQLSIE